MSGGSQTIGFNGSGRAGLWRELVVETAETRYEPGARFGVVIDQLPEGPATVRPRRIALAPEGLARKVTVEPGAASPV